MHSIPHGKAILIITLALILGIAVLTATGVLPLTTTGHTVLTTDKDTLMAIMGATHDQPAQFVLYEVTNNQLIPRLYPTADNPLAVYPEGVGYTAAIGDINNDRVHEILISGLDVPQLTPFVILNNKFTPLIPTGGGTPTTLTSLTPLGIDNDVIGASVAIGDIDSDRNNKVIIGQHYQPGSQGKTIYIIGYAWNSNEHKLEPEFIIPSGFRTGTTTGINVATGDIDNDGFDELVIGETFGSRTSKIKIIDNELNESNEPTILYEGNAFSNGEGVSIAIGNTDGQGREEIILGQGPEGSTTTAKIIRYVTNNTIETVVPATTVGLARYGTYIATADLSGDASEELIIGQGPNNVQNIGQSLFIYSVENNRLRLLNATGFIPAGPAGVLVTGGKPFTFNNNPRCGDGVCMNSIIELNEDETLTYGVYTLKLEDVRDFSIKLSLNGNILTSHTLTVGDAITFVNLYIELLEIREDTIRVRIGENHELCPIDCSE